MSDYVFCSVVEDDLVDENALSKRSVITKHTFGS